MKKLILIAGLLVLGCNKGNAEAKFEKECSINGYGKASCTFRNIGTKEGSICVQAVLRRWGGEHEYPKIIPRQELPYEKYDEREARSSNRMCSKLILPHDLEETTKQLSFYKRGNEKLIPGDFCSHKDKTYSWEERCLIWFDKVKYMTK